MPYIRVTTDKKITDEIDAALVSELGKAIELIPGKDERWLMISCHGTERIAFRGVRGNACMIEVDLLGSATPAAYSSLTQELTRIAADVLGVPGDRTYVKYGEYSSWGYDGENF